MGVYNDPSLPLGPPEAPSCNIEEMRDDVEGRGQPHDVVVLVHQVVHVVTPDRLSLILNLVKRMTETKQNNG